MNRKAVYENFTPDLGRHWQRLTLGQGSLETTGGRLRLVNTGTSARAYTNAQIDDYQHLARRHFLWRPPLSLTLRARFSHPGQHEAANRPVEATSLLRGTAGFGFWNDPFLMTSARLPTLPRAIWFFYSSPPSNMKLDWRTPGYGWKAATIDAGRLPFWLLVPTAPLAIPLMNLRPLYRRLWPVAQRAMYVNEAPIDVAMTDWHIYRIGWGIRTARFSIDGRTVLECTTPPRGPLGLVLWLDNQYMVVTPWGAFRHGILEKPGRQWLELDWLAVEPSGH